MVHYWKGITLKGIQESEKADTNVLFPFPDHHVCQNKELDILDRVLAEWVSMEYGTGEKENGLCVFKTSVHYIIYPAVTMGWDTSGRNNQTSFTSKHFHADFFFFFSWNHISKDSFYSTQQTPVFNSSFKPFFEQFIIDCKGTVQHFEMGFALMW